MVVNDLRTTNCSSEGSLPDGGLQYPQEMDNYSFIQYGDPFSHWCLCMYAVHRMEYSCQGRFAGSEAV